MIENIRLAFQGIWSHKMRSFLTMLGIIIGIASIIAIVSTIQGTNNALKEQLVGSGNNTVKVNLSQGGEIYQIYDSSSIPTGIPVISDDTRQRILALDNVEKMTSYTTRFVSDGVYYRDKSLSEFNIYGIDTDYFDTLAIRNHCTSFSYVLLEQSALRLLQKIEYPFVKILCFLKQRMSVFFINVESASSDFLVHLVRRLHSDSLICGTSDYESRAGYFGKLIPCIKSKNRVCIRKKSLVSLRF